MFGLGKKGPASYVDLHNSAVIKYRRACKSFIWVGIINFVGLIVGIIQFYIQGTADTVPFYYCFGICDFLFSWFAILPGLHPALFWVIVAIITIATSAGAVLLGLFSSYGKKSLLITMLCVYAADWVFVLLSFFLITNDTIGLMINAGIHVVASFFLILALYEYYNVLNVEKRFKNIPTVAETKAQEQEQKEESEADKE